MKPALREPLPYATMQVPASDSEPADLALVLSYKLAPEVIDQDGAHIEVTYEGGIVSWKNEKGRIFKLGSEDDPFDESASKHLTSEDGLLVLFVNLEHGAHENWAIFRAAR